MGLTFIKIIKNPDQSLTASPFTPPNCVLAVDWSIYFEHHRCLVTVVFILLLYVNKLCVWIVITSLACFFVFLTFVYVNICGCTVHVVEDGSPQEDCFGSYGMSQPTISSKKGRTFDEIREENRRKKQSKVRSQSPSSNAKKHKETQIVKGK